VTFVTTGIVLGHRPFRDYDLFCTIYSADRGKFDVLMRGARRTRSKLRSGMEMLNVVDVMVARGVNWQHLAGTQTKSAWPLLKQDYDKIIFALALVESVEVLTDEGVADGRIFSLLRDWFKFLNEYKISDNTPLFFYLVVWQLCKYSGYGPLVTQCLRCNGDITPDDQYFSVSEGGLVCNNCRRESDRLVSTAAIKLIRFWFQQESAYDACVTFRKIRISADLRAELKLLLVDFIQHILETRPKTFDFLPR